MKKLMSLMLGMALVFTAVAVSFGQDTTKKEDTTKKKSKKKKDTTKTSSSGPLSGYPTTCCWEAAQLGVARPSSVFSCLIAPAKVLPQSPLCAFRQDEFLLIVR